MMDVVRYNLYYGPIRTLVFLVIDGGVTMNMAIENISRIANPITSSTVQNAKNVAFAEELRESSVNAIIQEIHDKFGINVGESGHRIECYIPSEVLYQMTINDSLKKDVFTVLDDYTCLEFKRLMDEIDPPMKKVTLIFDKDANVVANCEADMKKLEEEYDQIKRKKQALSIFGPVSKKPYDLIIKYSEDGTPNIELQGIVASSVIKVPFGK